MQVRVQRRAFEGVHKSALRGRMKVKNFLASVTRLVAVPAGLLEAVISILGCHQHSTLDLDMP